MKRKIIAVLLSLSMLMQTPVTVNAQQISASAEQKTGEEKQYVVVAEDKKCYNELEEEIGNDVVVGASELEENNILVAELDAGQVAELEENEEVIIEEDIMISASSRKTQKNRNQKSRTQKKDVAKTKKQIQKQKEKLFEELDESREDAEKAESEWNIQAINADETLDEAEKSTGEKVKVAVLDSGIDSVNGLELAGYVNLVSEEQDIPVIFQDLTGHGTGIASIIAGNGEGGIQGVNPNVDLYSVRVLDEDNSAPLSRIIQGIYWCIENDIDIINMSFGTSVQSMAMQQAVEDAYSAGILMVAAAGNEDGEVEYPAAFDEVMAVAATTPEAEISSFSNTGEELDVAAPGESVRVSSFFNGSIVTHGTSIAVPHVTGVAALLWQKDMTKSNEFIRQLISCSAKEMEDTQECGLLDAEYALEMYDVFEQTFSDTKAMEKVDIPVNKEKPEVFDDISDDEAYVEGRWNIPEHDASVVAGASGFSQEAINIIKAGAVYPDQSIWKGAGNCPRWHGKWKTAKSENELNYVAVYELVTSVALEGGNVSSFNNYKQIWGISPSVFNTIRNDINAFVSQRANNVFNGLGVANTAENRKYFLWGCALHTMTDVFAHSTTKPDGKIIGHSHEGTYPDDITYYPKRYKVAMKLTEYSLACLRVGMCGDGEEVVKALNSEYKGKAAFKIINIKKYVNDNGYEAAVLSEANINK